MPGENLTRVEAQERAANLSVESYLVELDLSDDPKTFGSKTTVRFFAKAGSSTFIDAITDSVQAITLNGQSLDPKTHSDNIRIELPELAESNLLVVEARGKYSNSGEGLHRFVDPVDNEVYLYTQFEVPDSRRMFAVFEQPDLKATYEFQITANANWQVISNSTTPAAESLGNGKALWKFAPTPRMSSYITALIAGPYKVWTDERLIVTGKQIGRAHV